MLLGLVAVFLVRGYITGPKAGPAGAAANQAFSPVVVAAKPIDRGESLAAAALKVVRLPGRQRPAGRISFDQLKSSMVDARAWRCVRSP